MHSNPTPPVGDTEAQAALLMDITEPTATTLYNYDTDLDEEPGRLIEIGGEGPTEIHIN
ncbi:hypothetical protein ACFLYL_03355 [Chloroflexota bacterium]